MARDWTMTTAAAGGLVVLPLFINTLAGPAPRMPSTQTFDEALED